jgi:hypothetical protein
LPPVGASRLKATGDRRGHTNITKTASPKLKRSIALFAALIGDAITVAIFAGSIRHITAVGNSIFIAVQKRLTHVRDTVLITIWEFLAIVWVAILVAIDFAIIRETIVVTVRITLVGNTVDITVVAHQLAFIRNTIVVAIVAHATRTNIARIRNIVVVAVGECLADVRDSVVVTIG